MTTTDNVRPTRYVYLGYVQDGPRLWRLVDLTHEVCGLNPRVGPHYPTRAELLADLERYTRACWGE